MKKTIVSAAMLTVFATAAGAQQYDRKLEQAAMDVAASKMGELRGAIDVGQRLVIVEPIDRNKPTHLGADRSGGMIEMASSSFLRSF